MADHGRQISASLASVASERAARAGDDSLRARVTALKTYQQARFRRGYADLLADPRHGAAALFFLEELYGPEDFSDRDGQFARIVPALVRLFPEDIVETVERLVRLHALSERLDTTMGRQLSSTHITPAAYVRAWQLTGQADQRREQIALTLEVGEALDRFTRNAVLRHSLKLMRRPARAAGLSALQTFLERGFETFRAMKGSDQFLGTIAAREEALRRRLFEAEAGQLDLIDRDGVLDAADPLGQLPWS
jgi:hypothetical protein